LGGKKWRSTHPTASIASGRNSLRPRPTVALPHIIVEREREKLDRSPAAQRDGVLQIGREQQPPYQERMREERERMSERERERIDGREP
jgi:hypothetical protein